MCGYAIEHVHICVHGLVTHELFYTLKMKYKYVKHSFKIYFKTIAFNIMFAELHDGRYVKSYYKNDHMVSEIITPTDYHMAMFYYNMMGVL